MTNGDKSSYYIYLFIDPRSNTPFYVGKGKGNRYKNHFRPSDLSKPSYKNNKIKKIQSLNMSVRIEFPLINLSESEAFNAEKSLILEYGRADLKTGTLTNLTDGGEGVSGRIFTDEDRKKLSKRVSGNKNPNYGRKHPPEIKNTYQSYKLGKITTFMAENIQKREMII